MNLVDARRRQRVDEADLAVALLGADHALVRALDRLAIASEQGMVVAGALTAAAVGVAVGVSGTQAILAAAVVAAAALACTHGVRTATRRDRAIDLILDGRDEVPLHAVERERQRLCDPEHRRHLAEWLESTREQAHDPRRPTGPARPLFSAHVIAAVGPDLTGIATRIRDDHVSVRGIAMTERLLCQGGSALYGPEVEPLRCELRRIRLALGGGDGPPASRGPRGQLMDRGRGLVRRP